jgi:hypothetical protein
MCTLVIASRTVRFDIFPPSAAEALRAPRTGAAAFFFAFAIFLLYL